MNKVLNLKKLVYLLIVLLLITVFTGGVARCFYGFDWSDETYYIALAKRVIDGDKFFGNIIDLQMFMTILFLPFIKLFLFFNGGSYEGIILCFRLLYFLLQFISGILIMKISYDSNKNYLISIIVFLLAFFVPGDIRTISYNTIPYLCLYISVNLMIFCNNKHKQIVVGILSAIMIYAYPIMIVVALIFILYFYKYDKSIKYYLISGLITGLVLTVIFFSYLDFNNLSIGLERMFLNSEHSYTVRGKIVYFILGLLSVVKDSFNSYSIIICIMILIICMVNKRIKYDGYKISMLLLSLILLINLLQFGEFYDMQNAFFLIFGNILLYFVYKDKKIDSRIIFLGFICCIYPICSYIISNVSIRMFFRQLILVMILISILINKKNIQRLMILQIVLFLLTNYLRVYRDDDLWRLDYQINNGSAKYLYTSMDSYQKYNDVLDVIHRYDDSDGRILFINLLPFGYLETDKLVGSESAWRYHDYLTISSTTDTIIFIKSEYGITNGVDENFDKVYDYIEENKMISFNEECCIVYKK